MDYSADLTRAHKKISESSPAYRKLAPGIDFPAVVEYIKDLDEMFREIVLPHFDYEDDKLFQEILPLGGPDLILLVEKFKKEHKEIKEKLERVIEISARLWADPAAPQKDKDDLASLCNELIQDLIDHAREEDEKIFPLLRKNL